MKKGFTLVELIAVVVILGIILVIAVPKITDVINNAKINAVIKNEEMLIRATRNYLVSNNEKLPTEIGGTEEVTLEQLQTEELIQTIKSPFINGNCSGYVLITNIGNNKYDYTPHLNCVDPERGGAEADGLVLHYKFDDFQEYTENVVLNTNLNTGWSKNYQTNIIFNEIEPPVGVNSPTVGFDRGHNAGYWYSYGDYAPKIPGRTYTVSLYVKTLDSNFRINFYTADNSEIGRYWSEYITVPNDGKWHRLEWNSFTNPVNSESDSLSFNFSYNGSIGEPNTRTWFCAPQMEEKPYATPFVDGIREGIVTDYSAKNNHSILESSNTPRWLEESKIGKGSYEFNGINKFINAGNSNDLILSNGGSISAWINMSSWGGSSWSNTIVGKGYSSWTNHHYILFKHSNTNRLHLSVSNGSSALASNGPQTPNLELNKWYHIVATWNHQYKCIYYDGVLSECKSSSIMPINESAPISIGKTGNNGYYFNGLIDEVKIYNRALTAEEIKWIYNMSK